MYSVITFKMMVNSGHSEGSYVGNSDYNEDHLNKTGHPSKNNQMR